MTEKSGPRKRERVIIYPTTDLMMQAQYENAKPENRKKQEPHPLITTLDDFIKLLAQDFYQKKRRLLNLESKQLLLSILKQKQKEKALNVFSPLSGQEESSAQSLITLFKQLRENGLSKDQLSALGDSSLYWQDLILLFNAYQEAKEKLNLYDTYDVYDFIFNLNYEKDFSDVMKNYKDLEAYHFHFATPLEERFWSWCKNVFETCTVQRQPPPSWSDLKDITTDVIMGFDLNREVNDVLKEIKKSLLEGVKPHQWAIIVPKEEPYFSLLRLEMEKAQIPYSLALRQPLNNQPLIQALKILFKALKEPFSINLPQLLRTSLLNENSREATEVAGLWPAKGLKGNWTFWFNSLEKMRLQNKPFDLKDEDTEFRPRRLYQEEFFLKAEEILKKWQRDLSLIPQKASAEDYNDLFLQLCQSRGLEKRKQDINQLDIRDEERLLLHKEYQGAYLGFLDALNHCANLNYEEEEIKIWDLSEYLDYLIEYLEETFLPLPLGQPSGVAIGTPLRLRGQKFYATALLGLNEGVFPSLESPNWLLNNETLGTLRQLKFNWPDNLHKMEREEELLRTALDTAQVRRIISYSQRDLKGNSLSPSPFLLLLNWNLPNLIFSQGPASPFDLPPQETLSLRSALVSELAAGPKKKENLNYFNLQVGSEFISPHLKQSPSAYNLYRACPYAYFLSFCLRLEEPQGVSESLSPLDRGTLLHRIFQRLTEVWQIPLYQSKPINKDLCLELLDQVLEEMWQAPLLLDLAQPLWLAEKEVHKDLLVKWLDEEIELFQQDGARPILTEWYFGQEPLLRFTKENYPIQGKIDRVDLSPHNEIILYDYKSGSDDSYRGLKKDPLSNLQLPCYALAWEQLENTPLQSASYYFPGQGKNTPNLIGSFNQESWLDLKPQVLRLLQNFDNLIRKGHFPLEPLDSACKFCLYQEFCPKGGGLI